MRRCHFCSKVIWPLPWVHYGFWIRPDGSEAHWHAACKPQRESAKGRDAEGHLVLTLGPGAESPSRKGERA